jgi:hypothetical protein
MISFKQILQDKPIYPFSASPQVYRNLEKEVCAAVREFVQQFKEYLPPADVTEHAKGAHDAINDLESWIETKEGQ